jgi:chromate transporter
MAIEKADPTIAAIARGWTRIGITGFGGPPSHIALLQTLLVRDTRWMDAREFEDANAACQLLPGPASTQLAIFCAYRLAGPAGAAVGGFGFIAPAVVLILVLSSVFLGHAPPLWIRGAGAGAGAAVAAVALHAARGLIGPSVRRASATPHRTARWLVYAAAGAAAAALAGSYVVLALLGCGAIEVLVTRHHSALGVLVPASVSTGGLGALVWTAFKVGALSFGGGFVIVPLMQHDAVHSYHWMSNTHFLDAVALGQITPGPVVATVAAVGYAAAGVGGGLLAAAVAFVPSFAFILLGGRHFQRLLENQGARAFLDGAAPAAIGAIGGAAITLAAALHQGWQFGLLGLAAGSLLVFRRGVVQTLIASGVLGVILVIAGAPLPR